MTRNSTRPVTVALLGNPNTGKSTLFAGLVGTRQRTGNYPGVTVEKKVGRTTIDGTRFEIIDLPGTYSLAPHSPDEMVAVDVLLGRQSDVATPDVILCIVDASNLARNLYLVSQLLEIQRPTVIACNMMDVAQDKGVALDIAQLQTRLQVPIIPVQANRKLGLSELRQALKFAVEESSVPARSSPLPEAMQAEVSRLERQASASGRTVPRFLLERLVLDSGYLQAADLHGIDAPLRAAAIQARERLMTNGHSLAALETIARYQWVAGVTEGAVQQSSEPVETISDRLDRVLTHRWLGPVIFALLMLVIFQAVFNGAIWFMDSIETGLALLGDGVAAWVPAGALRSMLVSGVVGGVGSVLVFLPQIFILFFFIALLEDCGYMARAAFLMDRLMTRVGLSGKSFIPLLSSFACAVPGIMATRVIENRRDRLVTIMIAPLMTCSARLPVYVLLIAAFIPRRSIFPSLNLFGWQWSLGLQDVTMASLYLLGILVAVVVALLLKRTILPGETPPFVMELPSYKVPDVRVVLHRMLERGWAFIRRAGTLIFAVAIVVWAAGYFPHDSEQVETPFRSQQIQLQEEFAEAQTAVVPGGRSAAEIEAELARLENEIAGAYIRQSYLGRVGHWIEPLVRPLGWDWRIGCAVVASFPAREVVVGTLGVIYNLGENEGSTALRDSLRAARWDGTDRPVFNVPVALSIMVFFALCAQCVSTLAIIRRETNSWRWPLFSFTYMTLLAYVGAWITYQVSTRLIS
jgi:ferrous iron transport protein B